MASAGGQSPAAVENSKILKTGHLYKQGGSYRNWKRRYFVLRSSTLSYYVEEGDKTPKGVIDLSHGRGIRSKCECRLEEVEWPTSANQQLAFGLALQERTFFLYGLDEDAVEDWKKVLHRRIQKLGNPDKDFTKDPFIPESTSSKIVHVGGRIVTKASRRKKKRTESVVDESHEQKSTDGKDCTSSEATRDEAESAAAGNDGASGTTVEPGESIYQNTVVDNGDSAIGSIDCDSGGYYLKFKPQDVGALNNEDECIYQNS